jgi:hypothetical protein
MGKPGFGFEKIMGRRKSSGNAIEDMGAPPVQDSPPAPENRDSGSSGFHVLSHEEAERRRESAAMKKAVPEKRGGFGRFSAFGTNKTRQQSFEEESSSSKSKSSSGTNFSMNRENNRFGSTSTLPSSADADSQDNMFAHTRPHIPHAHTFSMTGMKKALPTPPKSRTFLPTGVHDDDDTAPGASNRTRAMTSSSYASTAVAPKLEADLSFDSSFDDMFSGLDGKRRSPELKEPNGSSNGRSLLAGKRGFQTKPLDINTGNTALDVEPPPKSWDSRGSGDRLIASPQDLSPPPPPPPHKYFSSPNGAVAEPVKTSSASYEDEDAKLVRASFIARKSMRQENSPVQKPISISSASALSLQTPLTSRTSSNNSATKESTPSSEGPLDHLEENLFASKNSEPEFKKPALPPANHNSPLTATPTQSNKSTPRVLTQAEFHQMKQHEKVQPPPEESDSDDYDDEEEAIQKREQEELMRRKQQQQRMARDHIRKSTVGSADANRPASGLGMSMGFPSEVSLKADDWSDEDVPLGILKEHGFPSRSKPPTRPENAAPSFISGSGMYPDRPASAGAAGRPMSTAYRPAFARKLPDDPFLGAGLVQPSNRESMGFNRGPASVHGGEGFGFTPGVPPGGLITRIQEQEEQRRLRQGGGASRRDASGAISYQGFNAITASATPTRMSQLPGANMPGVGMNQTPMMPMMGMNQMSPGMPMGYQMPQTSQEVFQMQQMQQFQQMQQMLAMQMQMMQMGGGMGGQMNGMQMPPMMNMAQMPPMQGMPPMGGFPNGAGNRPMSIASSRMMSPQQNGHLMPMHNQNRPNSTFGLQPPQPAPTTNYTPSIAPSERSNIGMAPRYRPIAINPQDGISTEGSSQTLQATGGAADRQSTFGKIKGILKKPSPSPSPAPLQKEEPDDENWGSLAARKKKFAKKTEQKADSGAEPDLKDLYRGLE